LFAYNTSLDAGWRRQERKFQGGFMLRVMVQDSGEEVILRCSGRIVRGEEGTLLCAAVRGHGRTVSLDLSGVETMDAAGIGLLVSLRAAGIYLRIVGPSRQVIDLLRLTGVESVVEIQETASAGKGPEREPVAV
jgi:anti-anti-sigma factor